MILDDDSVVIELLKHIGFIFNLNIYKYEPNQDNYQIYISSNIDVVIINFSSSKFKLLLHKIMEYNPKQKIITLSEHLECSHLYGCDHCIENHNKRRLLKPIDSKKLMSVLKDFDNTTCAYFDKFKNIFELFEEVATHFIGCTYDTHTREIHVLQSSYNFLRITSFLDYNKINYLVKGDNKILLLDTQINSCQREG